MAPYDIAMIAVLVGATTFGALKGLAWQVASVGSLVLSYFVCLRFRHLLTPLISAEEPVNQFVAMLILFLTTSLVVWLLFRYVSDFIDRLHLREFDRQIGALAGLAKGVLLCVVITFFVVTLWPEGREHVLKSRSGYYIAKLIDRADAVMPSEAHDLLGPYLHQLEQGLDPKSHPGGRADGYHGRGV